jgi:HD-GYP domain-containing protein (c-di-GMP phosphodiesterase class II)
VAGEGFTDKGGVAIRDLFDIARSFSLVTDLDLLLKKISAAAEKLTQSEASAVMLLNDSKDQLYFKTAGGEKGGFMKTVRIPVGTGVAGWVAQHGEPVLIEDVTKDPRFSANLTDDKSGFKTRSILCVPMTMSGELIGVMEVLNKKQEVAGGRFTSDDLEILGSLAGFAAVSIINSKLNTDQKNFFANIIEILIAAVETRSKNSPGHCWRVAQTCCLIARRLKISGQAYKNLYYAALLHDIGYLGAMRQLQTKKLAITPERVEQMHPVAGAELIESIHLLKECAPLIRASHEMWDGSGYPDKLKGEAIPLGARIIAFVEAIEDQRSSMMTEEEFLTMSEQYASKHVDVLFDPHVVAAYLIEVAAAKEAKV